MSHPEGDYGDGLVEVEVDELLASVGRTIEAPTPPPLPKRRTTTNDGDDSIDELLAAVSRSVESLPPPPPRAIVEPQGAIAILAHRDLVRARAFYEDLLGLVPETETDTSVRYRVGAGAHLVLGESAVVEPASILVTVIDLEEVQRRLDDAGATIEEAAVPGAGRAIFVRDPAGHRLGLTEPLPPP